MQLKDNTKLSGAVIPDRTGQPLRIDDSDIWDHIDEMDQEGIHSLAWPQTVTTPTNTMQKCLQHSFIPFDSN